MKMRSSFIFHYSRFVILFIVFFSVRHLALAQDMAIKIYTAKDGLPSTYIYGACEDNAGYLWIGSPDGLSRFDGKTFTNYGLTEGLPDSRVYGMHIDKTNRYWAVTAKGMVEFKGNKFISYPLSDHQKPRAAQSFETSDEHLYCLTNMGIYQFNNNKWDKIKLVTGYESNPCRTILEAADGLYINYGNLLLFKNHDGNIKIIGPLKKPGYYYNNLSGSAGRIFVSTLDGMYEIKNQVMVKLPGAPGKLKGLYCYFHDSKNRFWIARSKIGIQLLAEGDTTNLVNVYNGPLNFLPQSITEDSKGNIWIGSGNGLIRISEKIFKNFAVENVLHNTVIRNVIQPPVGNLLLNNGTLTLKSFEKNEFIDKQLMLSGKTGLLNNEMIIDGYAFDDKNRYWYYLRGFSLAMQEGSRIYEQSGKLAPLGTEVFNVIFDKYRRKIIVAVGEQKFPCIYNDTSYSLVKVTNKIDIVGSIRLLHQSHNGYILFTTDRGYVYSIDKQNYCKLELNEFTNEGVIKGLYNDTIGDVWIIYSGRGLRRYTWQKNSLVFKNDLTTNNGLPTNNPSSICFDNRNNLWVSVNSTVNVFTNKDDNYKMIDFFDAGELEVEGAYDARFTKDLEGNIWLFSDRLLICFYPDKINYKSTPPSLQIEKVELNLRQTNWAVYSDSLTGIFQLPVNPHLSHENNTIGIYFKGISSSGTEGIRYSYKLEGLDDHWSANTSNDFVSFVKLPPGKYVFKVKAQLPNTGWSAPAVFHFEIIKAFWQTWWFYLFVAGVITAAIYMLFRYRLNQKIKILEIRNRISQDLHDEIGASMSGINLLSQIAADKLQHNKPGEAAEYLSKVKNYSQDVIEKLSDMVWVFNPQNDSIEKLIQRLKSFSITIASSKDIQIHFITGKENAMENLTIRQRKALYLISKEAINNSLKYSSGRNIFYNLDTKESAWELVIKDDGKGFVYSEKLDGNGLKNIKARAAEINAEISIESQPGIGTTITVRI